jgi:hypothetical protein
MGEFVQGKMAARLAAAVTIVIVLLNIMLIGQLF